MQISEEMLQVIIRGVLLPMVADNQKRRYEKSAVYGLRQIDDRDSRQTDL